MSGAGEQSGRGGPAAAAEDPGTGRDVAGGGRGSSGGSAARGATGKSAARATRGSRPPGEGLAARVPGLIVALAGAGLLAWSLWSGSRPVEGLQRRGAEWLVPESGLELESAARAPRQDGAGGESAVMAGGPGTLAQGAGDPAAGGELLIDVNVATAAQFELLPDIGPVMAQRIVADRAANGRFATVDDLMRVPGIGPKTVEKIRGLVVCGGE